MAIRIKKLHPLVGAEVTGLSLAEPLEQDELAAIKAAWHKYGVLVFPAQPISDAQQVAFSRNFGALEIFPQADNRASQTPEIFRVTNVGADDRIRPLDTAAAKYSTLIWVWHTDSSYRSIPSKGAVLHAIEVVEKGGDTLFANMCAAYEKMPPQLRDEIAGRAIVFPIRARCKACRRWPRPRPLRCRRLSIPWCAATPMAARRCT